MIAQQDMEDTGAPLVFSPFYPASNHHGSYLYVVKLIFISTGIMTKPLRFSRAYSVGCVWIQSYDTTLLCILACS